MHYRDEWTEPDWLNSEDTMTTIEQDPTGLQGIIARLEADIAISIPFADVQPGRRFRFIGVGMPAGEFVKGGGQVWNYFAEDGHLHGHAGDGEPVVIC